MDKNQIETMTYEQATSLKAWVQKHSKALLTQCVTIDDEEEMLEALKIIDKRIAQLTNIREVIPAQKKNMSHAEHWIRLNLMYSSYEEYRQGLVKSLDAKSITDAEFYAELEQMRGTMRALQGEWSGDCECTAAGETYISKNRHRTFYEPEGEQDRFSLLDTNPNACLLTIDQSTRDIGDAIQHHQMELGPNGQMVFDKLYGRVGDGLVFDHVPSHSHNLPKWDVMAEGADFPVPVKVVDKKLVVDKEKCVKVRKELNGPIVKYVMPIRTLGGNLKKSVRYTEHYACPVCGLPGNKGELCIGNADMETGHSECECVYTETPDELAVALIERLDGRIEEEELDALVKTLDDSEESLKKYIEFTSREKLNTDLLQEVEQPTANDFTDMDMFVQDEDGEWGYTDEDAEEVRVIGGMTERASTPKDTWFVCGDAGQKFMDHIPEDHPLVHCIKSAVNFVSGPFFSKGGYADILWKGFYTKGPTGETSKCEQFPIMERTLKYWGDLAFKDELTIEHMEHGLLDIEKEWWELNCDEIELGGKVVKTHRCVVKVLNDFPQVRDLVDVMATIQHLHVTREADATAKIFEIDINGKTVLVDAVSKVGHDIFESLTVEKLAEQALYNHATDKNFVLAGNEAGLRMGRAILHGVIIRGLVMGRKSKIRVNGETKPLETVIPGFYGDFRRAIPPKVNVAILDGTQARIVDINRCSLAELQMLPFISKDLVKNIYWGRPWKEASLRVMRIAQTWLVSNPTATYPVIAKILATRDREAFKRLRIEIIKASGTLPKADLRTIWDVFNACTE